MMLHREPPVGALDLAVAGVPADAEHFVIVSLRHEYLAARQIRQAGFTATLTIAGRTSFPFEIVTPLKLFENRVIGRVAGVLTNHGYLMQVGIENSVPGAISIGSRPTFPSVSIRR